MCLAANLPPIRLPVNVLNLPQDHKLLQETLRHQAQDIRQLQDGKSESERRATEAERQVAILQGQLQQNQDDMVGANCYTSLDWWPPGFSL